MNRILSLAFIILVTSYAAFAQNFFISGGHVFSAALCANGQVYTWGSNNAGQLGLGTTGGSQSTPQWVNTGGLPSIQAVDAGSGSHVVGLACDGTVWTWGENCDGQLGNGSGGGQGAAPGGTCAASSNTPVQVRTGEQGHGSGFLQDVKYVTSGTSQSYAILENGRLMAWGSNNHGQLGANHGSGYSNTPVYVEDASGNPLQNVIAVDAQDYGCYALTADGQVWSWGQVTNGALGCNGCGTDSDHAIKVQVDRDGDNVADGDLDNVTMITAGDTHGLFLDEDGFLWSVGGDWGPGQRGNPINGFNNMDFATKVLAGDMKDSINDTYLANVEVISAGQATSYAVVRLNNKGYLLAWGANQIYSTPADKGTLGLGLTASEKKEPALVSNFYDGATLYTYKNVVSVSDGDGVVYVITYDETTKQREIWVTGANSNGQLGLGHTNPVGYLTKLTIPDCKIADPCPMADLGPKTAEKCLGYTDYLYAGSEGEYYKYKWYRDGVDITADTSATKGGAYLNISSFGEFVVEISDNRPINTCNPCPTVYDTIVITPYDSPVDSINTTFCGDGDVTFSFTSNYATGGIFDVYTNQTGGAVLQTITPTNMNVNTFTVPKASTSVVLADSILEVWLEDATTFPGTVAPTACGALSQDIDPTKTQTAFVAYENFILESVDVKFKSWSVGTASIRPVLYGTILKNGKEVANPADVLWTGSPHSFSTQNTDGYTITIPVNANITGTIRGTKYWLGFTTSDNLQMKYANCSPTWPNYVDNISGNAVVLAGQTKYDNNQDNEFGSIHNFKIEKTTSYPCGRIALRAIKVCPPCNQPQTVTIAVNPTDQNICAHETARLTTTPTQITDKFEIFWYKGTSVLTGSLVEGPIAATSDYIDVTWANADLYWVWIRDKENPDEVSCQTADSARIVANTTPTANADQDTAMCVGASYSLDATGAGTGGTYQWSNAVNASKNLVAPAATTTYTVTATTALGCTHTDLAVVTINPMPTANAGADDEICIGDAASITATGALTGGSYLWNTGATTAAITPAPTFTTTYTVTTTTTGGCTGTDNVVITAEKAIAQVDDASLCQGETLNLTATGGGTYLWSNGETTATFTVSDTVTTTYTVTVTMDGCTASDDAVVTILKSPVGVIGDTICSGAAGTISAVGNGTYAWSDGSTGSPISVSPLINTTYTVTVTIGICTASGSGLVIVNSNPTAYANSDTIICPGATATLWGGGAGSLQWSNGSTASTTTAAPAVKTTYTLTVTDANGCSDAEPVIVDVHPGAAPDAGPYKQICLNGNTNLTATGGGTYLWNVGNTNASITVNPLATTLYTVTVTAITGCTATDTVSVIVNPLPTASAGTDQQMCINGSTTLTASGGATYSWNTNATSATITVAPAASSNYTVTVLSSAGCSATDDMQVTVNPLPVVDAGSDLRVCKSLCINLSPTQNTNWNYSWSYADGSLDNNSGKTPSACYPNHASISADTDVLFKLSVTNTTTGCSNKDSVKVTFEEICKPYVYASADKNPICLGEQIVVSSQIQSLNPIVSFQWSDGTTSATFTASPAANTIYYVTVADDQGKTDGDSLTVVVNALPVAQTSVGGEICQGQTSTIITASANGGSGPYAFSWDNGAGNIASATVSPASTTTYVALVTDDNSCTDTETIVVTVNTPPIASGGQDITICPGLTGTLNASASGGGSSYSYLWDNAQTDASIDVTPLVDGTNYFVTVTDNKGCTDKDFVTAYLYPAADAEAGSNATICLNNSTTLTASDKNGTGGTYVWNTLEATPSITTSPAVTTTYSVTVTNTDGCVDTDDVKVSVNPLPVASAGTDQEKCLNEAATITAAGGTKYQWSDGKTTASITETRSPAGTYTYTVTVTDANSCSETDQMALTVKPLPTVDAGPAVTICRNDPATLTATGADLYGWSNSSNATTITVTPQNSTEYRVTGTSATTGCTASDAVVVTVAPIPTPDFTGSNDFVCEGRSGTVRVSFSNPQAYTWNTGGNTASIIVSPTANTVYTVTVSSINGCTETGQHSVRVSPLPDVDFTSNTEICQRDTVFYYNMTLFGDNRGTNPTYVWDFGDDTSATANVSSKPNPQHVYDYAGQYTVKLIAVNDDGCQDEAIKNNLVTVKPTPTANFYFDPKTPSNFYPEVNFFDNSLETDSWLWNFGDEESLGNTSIDEDPVHVFNTAGNFKTTLIAGNDGGCYDTLSINVYVKAEYTFYVPSSFTPNDDGHNDLFFPLGDGLEMGSIEMNIYSRWGEKIFTITDPTNGWNGRKENHSELCPDGVYSWVAKFRDLEGNAHDEVGIVLMLKGNGF